MKKGWIVLLLVMACAKKAEPTSAAVPPAMPTSEPAATVATTAARVEPVAVLPKLHLTLRSTPGGATASVDGKTVGVTPLAWDVVSDGKAHDFTFVMAGYEPWKVKFSPIKDGVVHASLKAIVTNDAGP